MLTKISSITLATSNSIQKEKFSVTQDKIVFFFLKNWVTQYRGNHAYKLIIELLFKKMLEKDSVENWFREQRIMNYLI